MGPHHHLASKRGKIYHYYINNKEVDKNAKTEVVKMEARMEVKIMDKMEDRMEVMKF